MKTTSLLKYVLSGSIVFTMTGCSISSSYLDNAKSSLSKIFKEKSNTIVINNKLISPIELKSKATTTSVGLEWDYKEAEAMKFVKGVYIYRLENDGVNTKFIRIDEINGKYTTHYVDKNLKPNTKYKYAVSVFNDLGEESKASNSIKVETGSKIQPVSYVFCKSNLPKSVKLMWRPHPNMQVKEYLIEKNVNNNWKLDKVITNRLSVEYIDTKLNHGETVRFRVKAKTYENVISNVSEEVKCNAKPRPLPVKYVKASNNLPQKIKLDWESSNDNDFSHYNVYRSIIGGFGYSPISKTKNNTFLDQVKDTDKKYSYKVTVVDTDGIESQESSPIEGKTLGKPFAPIITNIRLENDNIIVEWKNRDKRIAGYELEKSTKINFFQNKNTVFNNIKENKFIDIETVPGMTYSYQIVGIDTDGIKSEPSEEKVIKLPSIKEIK